MVARTGNREGQRGWIRRGSGNRGCLGSGRREDGVEMDRAARQYRGMRRHLELRRDRRRRAGKGYLTKMSLERRKNQRMTMRTTSDP